CPDWVAYALPVAFDQLHSVRFAQLHDGEGGERLGHRTDQERVGGVPSGPDSSASPKPCTCTIRSRCTMPSAKPGMRCTSISERTYRSMAARSGPPSAAAVADPSIADTMPQ